MFVALYNHTFVWPEAQPAFVVDIGVVYRIGATQHSSFMRQIYCVVGTAKV